MSRRTELAICVALLAAAIGAGVIAALAASDAWDPAYLQPPGDQRTLGSRMATVSQAAGPAAIVTVLLLLGFLYFLHLSMSHSVPISGEEVRHSELPDVELREPQ
jgi:hypothetical protein